MSKYGKYYYEGEYKDYGMYLRSLYPELCRIVNEYCGIRHGYGKMTYRSTFYEGEWKNDKINGFGEWAWSVGDRKTIYEGEWKNGIRVVHPDH